MRQVIKLNTAEEKTAKNGKIYKIYNTAEGKMSAFDKKLIETLDSHMGNEVEVEVENSGDFVNIRKFYRTHEVATEQIKEDKPAKLGSKLTAEERCFEQVFKVYSDLLGYGTAVDDTKMTHEARMDLAITLVNKAKEEFL